jgi:hypothetical protein
MPASNFLILDSYDGVVSSNNTRSAVNPESQYIIFFRDNLLLLGILGVVIFGYLLLLIRKRWKHNFLHPDQNKKP